MRVFCCLAVLSSVLACARPQPVERPNSPPEQALRAEILTTKITAPRRSNLLHSPGMLRFVDGDDAAAHRLTSGLAQTAQALDQASCETTAVDQATLDEIVGLTEDYILFAVLFSLAYEFDLGESPTTGKGPDQAIRILHALDERLETSDILFPKLELLTPEDAAQLADAHGSAEASLFPAYVELLYSMSKANAELADKKARIMEKISTLREAVTLVYVRGARGDIELTCKAIDSLHTAATEAMDWAVAGIDAGGRAATVYGVEVTVALTNVSTDASVVVPPQASVVVEYVDETTGELAVEDVALDGAELVDNNVPPGFTRLRTFVGESTRGMMRGCRLRALLSVDGEPFELDLAINACG
jgi:hypothetical protein